MRMSTTFPVCAGLLLLAQAASAEVVRIEVARRDDFGTHEWVIGRDSAGSMSSSEQPWRDWSDDELADAADNGMRGQGAVVESLRRHREALIGQQASATRLSWIMLALTIVGILVAGAAVF